MLKTLILTTLAMVFLTDNPGSKILIPENYEEDHLLKSYRSTSTLSYQSTESHKNEIKNYIRGALKRINFTRSNKNIIKPKNNFSNFKHSEIENPKCGNFYVENKLYYFLDELKDEQKITYDNQSYPFHSISKNHINPSNYLSFSHFDSKNPTKLNSSICLQKGGENSKYLIYENPSDDELMYESPKNSPSIDNNPPNRVRIDQKESITNNLDTLPKKHKKFSIHNLFSGLNRSERVKEHSIVKKVNENFQSCRNKFFQNRGESEIQKKFNKPETKQTYNKRKNMPLPPIPTNEYEEKHAHFYEFHPKTPSLDPDCIYEEISELPPINSQYQNNRFYEFESQNYKKTYGQNFSLKSPNVAKDQLFENPDKNISTNPELFRSGEISKNRESKNDLECELVVNEDIKDYSDGYITMNNFIPKNDFINDDKTEIYDDINALNIHYKPDESINHKLDESSAHGNIITRSEQNKEAQLKVLENEYENIDSHGNIEENEKQGKNSPIYKTLANEINCYEIAKNELKSKGDETTQDYNKEFEVKFVQGISENLDKKTTENFDQKPNENFDQKTDENFEQKTNENFEQKTNENFDQKTNEIFEQKTNENFDQKLNENFDQKPNEIFKQKTNEIFDQKTNEIFDQKMKQNPIIKRKNDFANVVFLPANPGIRFQQNFNNELNMILHKKIDKTYANTTIQNSDKCEYLQAADKNDDLNFHNPKTELEIVRTESTKKRDNLKDEDFFNTVINDSNSKEDISGDFNGKNKPTFSSKKSHSSTLVDNATGSSWVPYIIIGVGLCLFIILFFIF
ncbi:Pesticidal crystal protein Cry11Bb [Dictyocoela muelleri]|nr:Pesticidal crystal protein Cry11Bb [Dictyocoela muelleri]